MTRSILVYVVLTFECGPVGSCEDADGTRCIWMEPMRLVASLGQNRGKSYDATPSMEDNYTKNESVDKQQRGEAESKTHLRQCLLDHKIPISDV